MKKKLIEVALPLDAINEACIEDKNRKTGHIRNLHKWFAPMPLPAWRAFLFASLIDDPGVGEAAEAERSRLFGIIRRLVQVDIRRKKSVLDEARVELKKAIGDTPVTIVDPFCGGGSTVLEAQRLGLQAIASDLNPIPVLITTMLTSIPQRVADQGPVNPGEERVRSAPGLSGFAGDIVYYAKRVREMAWEKLSPLYPSGPSGETVTAWRWARTVPSPDPSRHGATTPLVSDWWLSRREGDECWVEAGWENPSAPLTYRIARRGEAPESTVGRGGARCIRGGAPIPLPYIRLCGKRGAMGLDLIALVCETKTGRQYVAASETHREAALAEVIPVTLDEPLPKKALGFRVQEYGFSRFGDLFTARQKQSLATFADMVDKIAEEIEREALQCGMPSRTDGIPEPKGNAKAYADAVVTFLGLCVGKLAQSNNVLVRWYIDSRNGSGQPLPAFDRHAVPMMWDFTETNPFGGSVGDWLQQVETALRALDWVEPYAPPADVRQLDARAVGNISISGPVVATDPPYFANIGYADLSDFFYVWLRRALRRVYPTLFATLLTPKETELIASPFRHENKTGADLYFRAGFTEVFTGLCRTHRPDIPMTIVYAYRQTEEKGDSGSWSTGWSEMLEGIIKANLSVVGTWPIRTNRLTRMIGLNTNALASAIMVMCRPRASDARTVTRGEFVTALKAELPVALTHLQRGNIAPVDLAQAAIGPGMAVYTRYAKVLDAEGKSLPVREALSLINQTLDEALAEQEGDFDADSRWALAWFEQSGFDEGEYGVAETLSKAKNTSIAGMVAAKILASSRGKVRLLKPSELPAKWDPTTQPRLTAWEMVHQLIRALEAGGEGAAGALVAKLGAKSEIGRELAYRLYTICERKKRAAEALAYNGLVQSWPEIVRLGQVGAAATPMQESLL